MTTTKSEASILIQGDVNSGRGQFGQCVFLTPSVAAINQTVLSIPTATQPFGDYYNKYVITPIANTTFNLSVIGTILNEGYSLIIINKSTSFNLIIRDSSSGIIYTLLPYYQISLIAKSAPITWNISNISNTNEQIGPIIINTITTTDNTPTTILTIPTATNKAYQISNSIIGYSQPDDESCGFILNGLVTNTSGTLTLIGSSLQTIGRSNILLNSYINISGTNILIIIVGLNLVTINWKIETKIISV